MWEDWNSSGRPPGKGGKSGKGGRSKIRGGGKMFGGGIGGVLFIWDILQEMCLEGAYTGFDCLPENDSIANSCSADWES